MSVSTVGGLSAGLSRLDFVINTTDHKGKHKEKGTGKEQTKVIIKERARENAAQGPDNGKWDLRVCHQAA